MASEGSRKLRMGMIGGGEGSFIGKIHRIAASMDGLIELVCGAFSSHPEVSLSSGKALFLPPNRIYSSYQQMIEGESRLPDDEKMDFVVIVTPNHVHFEPAMMALDAGFHIIIDKPITFSLEEAKTLKRKVADTGLLLCLTHTYSGYPMVKQARQMVQDNAFGSIRKIIVEYPQGWLSMPAENENAQAAWRTDPQRSGKSGCMGDIGTHAAHLAEYISGLRITEVCAELNTVVAGRALDDDGTVLLKFDGGCSGVLIASQIAAGEENPLKIRIYGERGGMEWAQQEPNSLLVKCLDKPMQVYRTGVSYNEPLSSYAAHNTRTPGGHPEGYLEAFGNIYRNFALTLQARLQGAEPTKEQLDFPGVEDGVRGMAFIETVVESNRSEQKWTRFID